MPNLSVPGTVKFDSTAVTGTGAVTLDGTAASVFIVSLTGNVTSFAFANVPNGQIVEVHFIQDATGSRTLAGIDSSVKTAGTLTLTTTANKRDVVRWRNVSGVFYEVGRSLNQ